MTEKPSSRQRDVVVRLGRGFELREVAVQMNISVNTAQSYIFKAELHTQTANQEQVLYALLRSGEMLLTEVFSTEKIVCMRSAAADFSCRQLGLIADVTTGASDEALARTWHVCPKSIGNELRDLKEKLGICSRIQFAAVAFALQLEPSERKIQLREKLLPAELRLVRQLVAGAKNVDIGRKLGFTEDTVKTLLTPIQARLRAQNRYELIRKAIREKLIRIRADWQREAEQKFFTIALFEARTFLIAQLAALGTSNKIIGEILGISKAVAAKGLTHIFRKLRIERREHLVRIFSILELGKGLPQN